MKVHLLLAICMVVALAAVVVSCGEVTGQRKYVVYNTIFIDHSEHAKVDLGIEVPVDMAKKYDTKPDIKPNVQVPLIPGSTKQPPPQDWHCIDFLTVEPNVACWDREGKSLPLQWCTDVPWYWKNPYELLLRP